MTQDQTLTQKTLRLDLPHPTTLVRDKAVSLATTCFSFGDSDDVRPDEIHDRQLVTEARRLASFVDRADCQEAILEKLRSFVHLACEAQQVSLGYLQLAKSVDALTEQLHTLKELVERRKRPR